MLIVIGLVIHSGKWALGGAVHQGHFDQQDHPIEFSDWLSSELRYSKFAGSHTYERGYCLVCLVLRSNIPATELFLELLVCE